MNSLEALDALRSKEEADEDAVIYMTITHSYTKKQSRVDKDYDCSAQREIKRELENKGVMEALATVLRLFLQV